MRPFLLSAGADAGAGDTLDEVVGHGLVVLELHRVLARAVGRDGGLERGIGGGVDRVEPQIGLLGAGVEIGASIVEPEDLVADGFAKVRRDAAHGGAQLLEDLGGMRFKAGDIGGYGGRSLGQSVLPRCPPLRVPEAPRCVTS